LLAATGIFPYTKGNNKEKRLFPMLSENIRNFRKAKGLSQEELAEKCNVSRQSITKWEASESIPTIDKLILLADIFDIS
jgi:transcriptional regulator with XRE-family HTH domain